MNSPKKLSTWLYITSFIFAVLTVILLFSALNKLFPVHTLVDTGADNISDILGTLDDSLGIPDAITPPTSIYTPVPSDEYSYSFVLAGNDFRPGRALECPECFPTYTDAFVYVNIVLGDNPQITMVSLPRELYLHVDGIEPDSRINQFYARGGIEWIQLWAETILNVEIDGVIVVSMDSFEQIVDGLGGIDIVPTETFRDKCGDNFYEYTQNEAYHLDGFSALCYARMRYYNPRGYFARQERHMDILESIFHASITEFAEDPIVTSVKMVSLYYELVETNLSPEYIAKIVGDVVITYYGLDETPRINTFSIDRSGLELYPRANDESPFLYRPTFVISEWLACVLGQNNNCDLD